MGESHDLSCDWTGSCDSSGQGSIDLMVSILERSIYIFCFLVVGAPSPWAPAMPRPTFPWSVMDMCLQWASYSVMGKFPHRCEDSSVSLPFPHMHCVARYSSYVPAEIGWHNRRVEGVDENSADHEHGEPCCSLQPVSFVWGKGSYFYKICSHAVRLS